ncbi:MAG: flagellar basal body P-ring formation protein FlgA [Firmicutes bacterium]|jgi:flagella basal body P-ring formation protein FlgA|nr:flagellar basal body P-ring formation chaperone FlgA [Bacillota bacterium]NLO66855.1 flagellar basal body P-ring formation protein FlgA [Bacillota bacterium]
MRMLRFSRALALVLFSLLILITPASAADNGEKVILTLPATASVEGRSLILGEIAEISGPPELAAQVAAVNAGAAPSAGSSRLLTKGQIEVRLRQARLDLNLVEIQGADSVTVYGAVKTAPGQTNANGLDGGTEVVVAARDLPRGHVISAEDLALESKQSRTASAVYNVEELIGLRTTRYVRSGSEITHSAVEVVPAVERGDTVQIIVRTEGIAVSAPGTARAAGGLGEIIPVENTLSRKVVYGRIVAPDTVEVDIRGSNTP